ncbi:MAG: hypothetical protein K0R82_2253 [Flavipsychrobacter sp.]|jgi:hypothetical protein|nr:hypothetical protein [Flavipsychrobacter sp.]
MRYLCISSISDLVLLKRLLFLLCFIPVCAFAQKVNINGKEGYRKLTWEDFHGKAEKRSPYTAITYWTLGWFNDKAETAKDGGFVCDPQVEVCFTPDSWVNDKECTPELLQHEQGHMDIAVLCAAELEQKIKSTTFRPATFEATMNALYEEALAKCQAMQAQYDEETGHSLIPAEQARWENHIAQKLVHYQQLSAAN